MSCEELANNTTYTEMRPDVCVAGISLDFTPNGMSYGGEALWPMMPTSISQDAFPPSPLLGSTGARAAWSATSAGTTIHLLTNYTRAPCSR